MLNILICDDQEDHLEYIYQLTLKNTKNTRVIPFNNAEKLIHYLAKNLSRVDIIICDIELQGSNGIEITRKIKKLNPNIQIIFISAYISYFQEVYSVDHVYFLAKPINSVKFQQAIETAKTKAHKMKHEYIVITHKNETYAINLHDIEYIEAALRQIKIHTPEAVYTKYSKIGEFVQELDQRFLICHKSYAVNLDKVVQLCKNKFILKSQVEIPISRSKYNYAKTTFIDYLGGTP